MSRRILTWAGAAGGTRTQMETETEYQFKLEVEVLELSSDLSPESSAGTQTSKTTEMKDTQEMIKGLGT